MIVNEPPPALRRPGQACGLPNHCTMIVNEPPPALRRPGQACGLPNHCTMIVNEPPPALRRPGQACGLLNHCTMIVNEPPPALRRPGQACGLPNHCTMISRKRKSRAEEARKKFRAGERTAWNFNIGRKWEKADAGCFRNPWPSSARSAEGRVGFPFRRRLPCSPRGWRPRFCRPRSRPPCRRDRPRPPVRRGTQAGWD